jgi:DNA uptake protein ComE-like DNA-binding protein
VKTVVAARDKLGAFTSVEELVAYDALTPERADELRDLMIFR